MTNRVAEFTGRCDSPINVPDLGGLYGNRYEGYNLRMQCKESKGLRPLTGVLRQGWYWRVLCSHLWNSITLLRSFT